MSDFQSFIFTSPEKAAAVPQPPGGIFIGTVTDVSDTTCYVEIPALLPGFSFGPCRSVLSPIYKELENEKRYSEYEDPLVTEHHRHEIAIIAERGDQVICAFINNKLDEVVVLGRLA